VVNFVLKLLRRELLRIPSRCHLVRSHIRSS
jgi:hypothetical protein